MYDKTNLTFPIQYQFATYRCIQNMHTISDNQTQHDNIIISTKSILN